MRLEVKLNPAWVRPPRSPGDRRLWLFGCVAIRHEVRVNSVLRVEVYPKRLLAAAAVLAVVGYLAAATALWSWLRRTPQNQVGWTLAATAPFRWETFRAKRGDTDIALAQERLKRQEWGEAYFALRTGVARSPGNVPGRLALAALLNGSSPEQALRTLETGLERSAGDPDLLRALFALYQQQQAGARALERSAELLARQPPLDPAARQVATHARAALLLARGDLAAAAALLDPLALTGNGNEDRRTRLLRADLRRLQGRLTEATAELSAAGTAAGTPDFLRAAAEVAVAARDTAALEGVFRRWRAAGEDQPAPYLFAFQAWHRLGRLSLRDRVEQDFYEAFGHRESALQLFAAVAVGLELPDAVRRAEDAARRAGFSRFAFRVHLTELALRAGDFDGAFRLLPDWERQIETLPPAQRAYPEFINRLTRAAVGGPAQPVTTVAAQVAEMRGSASPGVSLLAATVLERSGHRAGAQELLALGLRVYPDSDPLRERAAAFAARLDAERAQATAAAEPRGARPTTFPAAGPALAALDDHLAAGRLVDARELLRDFRAAAPAWLDAAEADVARRELHLSLLTRDALAARAAVRTHLGRHPGADPALRLLDLASTLAAAGHPEAARILRAEVAAARGTLPPVADALRGAEAVDATEVPATAAEAVAAVDAALRRDDADHALLLVAEFRRLSPHLLRDVADDLTVREIRARLQKDQRPSALFALRGLVLRPGASRMAAFTLVRDLAAAGDDQTARTLAREIVRLLPGQPAAAGLLKELDAPRPPPG
jgi:hypothetical protein